MNAVNNLVRLYLHNHSHPLGSLAGLTIEETIKFAALDAPPPFDDNGVAKGCPFGPFNFILPMKRVFQAERPSGGECRKPR